MAGRLKEFNLKLVEQITVPEGAVSTSGTGTSASQMVFEIISIEWMGPISREE